MKIIHDGSKVLARISDDKTEIKTLHTVFSGSPEECAAEIARLKLREPTPQNRRIDDHLP
jgi:alkanesulfonate monooxygenase SsuD/methylene tetrahydromethanopterin reductase-like flavin-dependent oxidoreductase (luciferase family)